MFNYNCKEDFLDELREYLENETTLSKGSIQTYLQKIGKILDGSWSVADLCGGIDALIKDYSAGGRYYIKNDSGNTRAALQKVRLFVRKKLLDDFGNFEIVYKKGWQSFAPKGKHYVEYKIDGGVITIKYNKHFVPILKPEIKDIPTNDLRYLIYLLENAVSLNLLAESNTAINTVHGTIQSYDYEIGGKYGSNCALLFKDVKTKAAENLHKSYAALIEKLIG